jgi:hypothetical protein
MTMLKLPFATLLLLMILTLCEGGKVKGGVARAKGARSPKGVDSLSGSAIRAHRGEVSSQRRLVSTRKYNMSRKNQNQKRKRSL